MADSNEKWINIDEAAEYLGVKPGTVRGWLRKDKGIPAHKIGKQWKFKLSELDACTVTLEELKLIADVMGVTFEQSFIFPNGEQIKTSNE